jgi:hypothetical protein
MVGRENIAPFARRGLFGQHLAIKIGNFLVAEHVVLHDLEIRLYEIGDTSGSDSNLLMHLRAVDATALLEDHHQPLAFFPRGLDVLRNIPERQGEPVLLVQTVLADLRRPGLDGKGRDGDRCNYHLSDHHLSPIQS